MTMGETTIVVGSYNNSASEAGLTVFRTGSLALGTDHVELEELPALNAESPAYVVPHPNGRWYYAVTDTTDSEILTFTVDRTATRQIGSVSTSGAGACHVALSTDHRFLVVAHYIDGMLTSHRIGENGLPSPVVDTHQFADGVAEDGKESMSHPHQVVAFGSELLVPDMGTDNIHRVSLNGQGRFVVAGPPIAVTPGSGPRHLVIDSEDRLLVSCELSAQVLLLRNDEKGWQVRDAISTTLSTRPCRPSAIRLNGDEVVVANRGPDTFSVIGFGRDTDELSLLTEVPAGGRWPRDLAIRDGQIWVACQRSHTLSIFRDRAEFDDELGEVDDDIEWRLDFQIATRSPACLVVRTDPS